MSALQDLWQMNTVGYITPRGVIALAAQHETLATSLGYARPATVRAASSWDTGTRATVAEVRAWEDWYNGVAARAGIPATTVLAETAATGEQWSTLRATATSRATPTAVQAYFTNAADAWNTMRASVEPSTLAGSITSTITDAERALQAWWFRRLGGASGTPAAFVRGDGIATTPPTPTNPATPATPNTATSSTPFQLDGDTLLKGAAIYLGFKFLTKGRRGRR